MLALLNFSHRVLMEIEGGDDAKLMDDAGPKQIACLLARVLAFVTLEL
jgi:hypothetical protein